MLRAIRKGLQPPGKTLRAAVISTLTSLMLAVGPFIGLTAAADSGARETSCSAMLGVAPERVRGLEAVQACRGGDAGCAYMEDATGYAVLTLICSPSSVVQVVGADRLAALRIQDGALAGDCSAGSWRRDAGLPGCYPVSPVQGR